MSTAMMHTGSSRSCSAIGVTTACGWRPNCCSFRRCCARETRKSRKQKVTVGPHGNGSSNGRSKNAIVAASAQNYHQQPRSQYQRQQPQGVDQQIQALFSEVSQGRIRPDDAVQQLSQLRQLAATPHQSTGDHAAVDLYRERRTGFPEVVWGAGKSPLQIATIMHTLIDRDQLAVATRVDAQVAAEVQSMLPSEVQYYEQAMMLVLRPDSAATLPRMAGTVAVLTAGTGDAFVAEECRRTAELMGCYTFRLQDLGIDSGLDRIVQNLPAVRAADVVVVISGMDGSMPSVIAGLVDSPVVAVPTSVGYGAALGGISPLLSALTAGAPGVATVNIDNGFGAAMLAARILHTSNKLCKRVEAARAQSCA